MSFKLPDLPYAHDALEPHIDARTMEIHHGKHHAGYTKKLNSAIEGTDMEGKSIEEILKNLDMSNKAVRNNGGGYFNHSLFWNVMSPDGGSASGELSGAIDDAFGSMDGFKDKLKSAGGGQFGSGWAWLCVHPGGKLEICSSANQDNPLMPGIGCGGYPILGVDVWEHAYYLHYQNKRPDYLAAFTEVINWNHVSELYAKHK